MNNTLATTEMKSVLDLLKENPNAIELSEKDIVRYNTCDHPKHKKGDNGKSQIVYSLYAINIKEDKGFAQNINAWGRYLEEVVTLSEIVAIY